MCNQMNVHCKDGNVEIQKTLNPRMYCLRNGLIFINSLFTLLAGFSIAAGFEIIGIYNGFNGFLCWNYKVFPYSLIVHGVVLLFITPFGWYGTLKQNSCAMKVYFLLIFPLIIFNCAIAISSFITYNNIEIFIDTTMFTSMKYFEVDENIRSLWNYIQEEYSCCGVYFPENWYGLKGDGINGGLLLQHKGFNVRFPYSCCDQGDCKGNTIYEDGCAKHIIGYVSKATLFCACTSIGWVIIQAIAAIVAYSFGSQVLQRLNITSIHKHLRGRSIVLISSDSDGHGKPNFV